MRQKSLGDLKREVEKTLPSVFEKFVGLVLLEAAWGVFPLSLEVKSSGALRV